MPTYTNTRTLLGDQGALDALVTDTLTILADDSVKTLRSGALYARKQLQEVYLPNLENLTNNAFMQCTALKKVFVGLNSETVLPGSGYFTAEHLPGRALLYVPDALVSAYRAENRYKAIASRIFGVSDEGKYEWDDSEISDSWDTILTNVQNGTAAAIYHLGQYKRLDLYALGNIEFQIIGINEDDLASGSGKAQLTWFPRSVLPDVRHRMNPALSNDTPGTGTIGSMAYCEGQTYLDETVYPMIPDAVRAAIKSVRKYTAGYDTSGTLNQNIETSMKLFLLSAHETNPGTVRSNVETLGPTYGIAFTEKAVKVRKNITGATGINYWLRSAENKTNYASITTDGTYTNGQAANTNYYLAFGFCT